MKCGLIRFSAVLVWGILPAYLLQGEATYQIQPVSLPGASRVLVIDINNGGTITGAETLNDGTDTSVVFQLGKEPTVVNPVVGDWRGGATYINSLGVAVGNSQGTDPKLVVMHAIKWSPSNGTQALSTPVGWYSQAGGINDQGMAVGSIGDQRNIQWPEAAVWDAQGNITILPQYLGASQINNHGQIIVDDWSNDYLLTPGSNPAVIVGLGGGNVSTMGLTDAGVIVGRSLTLAGRYHAFLSTSPETAIDLTPGADCDTVAIDINSYDQVIGYIDGRGSSIPTDGFLYENGQLSDLLSLAGASAQGWNYLYPTAINDNGWIVGNGVYNGVWQSFLMTPVTGNSAAPEPASLAILGVGLSELLAARRRN